MNKTSWKSRLPSLIPLILFLSVYIVVIVLFFAKRKEALVWLQEFGENVKALSFWGYIITALVILLTAIPPVPGYSFALALSGVIYGWWGLIPSYFGALIGSIITFVVFRRYGQNYTQRMIEANPKICAVVRACEDAGFKFVLLARIGMGPFNFMSAVFGASRVSFSHFILATVIVLPRIALNIALGANLQVLSDSLFENPSWINWLIFILSATAAIGLVVYLGWISRRALSKYNEEHGRPETSTDEEVAVVQTV